MRDETHHVSKMLARIHYLENELATCRAENTRRSQELAFLKRHPTIALGIKGEKLVARLLKLPRTTGNASHDIGDEIRFEVKMANPTNENRSSRWEWGRVLGMRNKKRYDRLILVGAKDENCISSYLKSEDPYVFFDVPHNEVFSLTTKGDEESRMIKLCSNPLTVRCSKARPLYSSRYQVTADLIESIYELRVAGGGNSASGCGGGTSAGVCTEADQPEDCRGG